MKSKLILAALLILTTLTAGCCTNPDTFVLLPDPDGKVGKITVTTEGGWSTVTKAGYSTQVASSGATPSEPAKMDPTEIQSRFGTALKAQPAQALVFIIRFDSGSARLNPQSREQIPLILAAIKERRSNYISIVGHADATGSADLNRRLSRKRAEAVRDVLVEKGVDPASLELDYHGANNPLVPAPPNKPEPRNRRVEVTVR